MVVIDPREGVVIRQNDPPVYDNAGFRKKFSTDLHEIFRDGWQWAMEERVNFWW